MKTPTEEQLIKEAKKIDDPYLSFWQKVEMLRRYYNSINNSEEGFSWEEVKRDCLKRIKGVRSHDKKQNKVYINGQYRNA